MTDKREKLKELIDGCFINVELSNSMDEKEYWSSVDEVIDLIESEIRKAKAETAEYFKQSIDRYATTIVFSDELVDICYEIISQNTEPKE